MREAVQLLVISLIVFFRLVLPDRTFFFFANNEEDCTQWVDLLKAIIQQVRDYRVIHVWI